MVPRLPVAVSEVTPDPLEEALRLLARLRVRLCDAWIRAGVRVTLRPLLSRLPVVGAVQVRCGVACGPVCGACAVSGCSGAGTLVMGRAAVTARVPACQSRRWA